jgi:hypothetical protein
MYISNQLLGARLRFTRSFRTFRCSTRDGSFVVEAIQVTSRLLKLLDPFFRLRASVRQSLVLRLADQKL